MERPKLFHALVVMGAALTGGTVAATTTTGCGSSGSTCNPQFDSTCGQDKGYGTIQAVPCDAAGTCFGHIAADSSDAYAHIGIPMDAPNDNYANISIDAQPADAPSDAPNDGGSEAG